MRQETDRRVFVSGSSNWRSRIGKLAVASGLIGSLWLSGCGGGPKGPKRVAISGKVTREGQDVDRGNISFTPVDGGPGASVDIANGVYKFDESNGPLVGKSKVTILHFPPLGDAPPETPKKDIPVLPETRFKNKMPKNGFVKEAEIKTGQTEPVDFHIDE